MDFLGTFLLVVQMVATYRQLKDGRDTSATDFLVYLERHHHAELKAFIEGNAGMLKGIEALLQWNHAEVLEQMGVLNKLSVQILSKLDAFRPLLANAAPSAALEGEAVDLVRHFYASGASLLFMIPRNSGPGAFQFGDTGKGLTYDEPRFMDDDCDTLVALGLLSEEPELEGHYGWRRFRATRAGARFASALNA